MEAQNTPGMWHHYCPAEQTCLGVAAGQPCNWCDTKEPHGADLRDDPTDPIKGD